jgi:hypothetical protein
MRKRYLFPVVMLVVSLLIFLFSNCALSYAFTLPATGQTTCYDDSGNVISCTGTGQDGANIRNPLSYTDNGDGTVTDNVTGLMWEKQDDGNTYNWYQASGTYDATNNPISQNVCGGLSVGGYSDWCRRYRESPQNRYLGQC